MRLELNDDDRAFRDELRAWLDDNLRHADDAHKWHDALVKGRWVVPAWPERFGGRACTTTQEIVYNLEMGARNAPVPRNAIGLFNIGPLLLDMGTAEQQERFLPPMVTAEEIWCQGFSEPNAGSDLASLQTRAIDAGDHWIVSGQKSWNTYGNDAHYCLALARTDPEARKHRGLSALIIDMHADGVTVRPLREITGDDGFNEIFFDEVPVPKDHIIGEINAGWSVAMGTLLYERLGTMKLGVQLERCLGSVVQLAKELDRDGDPYVRQRAAALGIQVDLMQLLTERALIAIQRGQAPGACLPLGKLQWSYLMQDLAELALQIAGPRAQLYRGAKHEVTGDWPYHCVYSRMTTIGAGTTEVQKNIIAYRSLGLPRDASASPRAPEPRDRELDETRWAMRDNTRKLLASHCPISFVREMYDDPRGTTDAVWSAICDLGLPAMLIAEEHGGHGLGWEDMGIVLEELGRAVHPGPFMTSAVSSVAALTAIASEPEELLSGIASGTTVAALATHEPTGGYGWRQPQARWTDGKLSGTKVVPDGAAATLFLVSAMDGDELALLAVDADAAVVTPQPVVDGTRKLAEVHFDRAPARLLSSGDISVGLADALDRIAVSLVVDAVGAADQALALATEYAKVRVQFERPIGSFQAVQHKLADMLRNVELARSGVYEALRLADTADRPAFHRAATMAKAYASDALYRVTADAIQVFGGIGFAWEHDAHLYYKRTMSMRHALGGTPEYETEYARLLFAP